MTCEENIFREKNNKGLNFFVFGRSQFGRTRKVDLKNLLFLGCVLTDMKGNISAPVSFIEDGSAIVVMLIKITFQL